MASLPHRVCAGAVLFVAFYPAPGTRPRLSAASRADGASRTAERRQPGDEGSGDYRFQPPDASGDHIERGEPKPSHSYFFSIGDWGTARCEEAQRKGDKSGVGHEACLGKTELQKLVAKVMAKLAQGLKPSFIISLGDNFYNSGVTDVNDLQFEHSFVNIYKDLKDVPWKILLGDHDHKGNVAAQLEYSAKNTIWNIPSLYYSFSVPVPGGEGREVEVIMADSMCLEGAMDPELVKKRRYHDRLDPNFSGAEAGSKQWKWLEDKLKQKTPYAARIVATHRPVVSAGRRDRAPSESALSDRLHGVLAGSAERTPLLYLHGHDHLMQAWKDTSGNLVHAGNGAGSAILLKLGDNLQREEKGMQLQWASDDQNGFVVHELGSDALTSYFVGASSGKVLNSVRLPLTPV